MTITGNQIGVFRTPAGTVKIPNALAGIKIENSESVLVGSIVTETTEARNVIAGNGGDGISIIGATSQINRINHSVIGTDEFGTANIGNAGDGVSVYGGGANIIGGNFFIGLTPESSCTEHRHSIYIRGKILRIASSRRRVESVVRRGSPNHAHLKNVLPLPQ